MFLPLHTCISGRMSGVEGQSLTLKGDGGAVWMQLEGYRHRAGRNAAKWDDSETVRQ